MTRRLPATGPDPIMQAVRAYQEQRGLSHDGMAARLQLTPRGLSYLYSGARRPNVETLALILRLDIEHIDRLGLDYVKRAAP